ncbi:MAG: Fic family protein, partial [Gammaproteobacteria bacterium]|nr:Fic family protein [Gammaproteobacteria bacterium]
MINIKNAYDYACNIAQSKDWKPDLTGVLEIHRLLCKELDDGENANPPGVLRDNPKNTLTRVGDAEHGGNYKPPQFGRDIRALLEALLEWHADLAAAGIPALLRAPLLHLYFELIHPFWDGNGRVGRVLEAAVLHAAGFRYAPFAQANFYLRNIHRYFALFNQCRKAAKAKRPFPNHAFVDFFLQGMLETINHLHDRVNQFIDVLLLQTLV